MKLTLLRVVTLALSIAVPLAPSWADEVKDTPVSDAVVADLIKDLELPASSPNLQRRRDAARQLAQMGPLPSVAIEPLAKALDTPDRLGVQRYARDALARAGVRAIPALTGACQGSAKTGEGCQASIGVLGLIARHEPAAWPVLIADFDSPCGGGTAVALGKLGAPIVPLLRETLKSANAKYRAMAAEALADVGPPAKTAVPDLLALLGDTAGQAQARSGDWPSPVVRYAAAIALANVDATRKEPLPVLIEASSNKWQTGADAIGALARMGSNAQAAIPSLEQIVAGESNRVPALEAITSIEGCSAGHLLADRLKKDQDRTLRFHAARALADLACPESIPALTEALGDDGIDAASELVRLGKPGLAALTPALHSADLDERKRVVTALTNLELKEPWVGKGEEATRPLPDDLIQPLMVAMTDQSIMIRDQAALVLQQAGGEPARLAAAQLQREDAADAQASALDQTPRSKEEILASIPPDADHKYPLTMEYLFPLYQSVGLGEPGFLITLHRGQERADRLVFWRKVSADRYVQAKVMESSEIDPSEGRFLPPVAFRAKVLVRGEGRDYEEIRQFVDVPQEGCNTWCVVDNVFVIENDFVPVAIEAPEKWYKSKLKPGESIWNSSRNFFSDNQLGFSFSIWAAEDSHAGPSAGSVTGTYRIIRERSLAGGSMIASPPWSWSEPPIMITRNSPPAVTWKMVVDTVERSPGSAR